MQVETHMVTAVIIIAGTGQAAFGKDQPSELLRYLPFKVRKVPETCRSLAHRLLLLCRINRHPNNSVSIKVDKQSDFYLVLLSIAGMKISQGNSSGSGAGII